MTEVAEAINLPAQLKGPWDSVLFLTFGLQPGFYENVLFRVLADRCRNRVILCDGDEYQGVCRRIEDSSEQPRSLNQRYVVSGVYCPAGVAHAKCILLANRDEGRLLVGSGNLGMGGYSLNKELFTVWDYNPEKPGRRAEFMAVREMVDRLGAKGWFQQETDRQIQAMWDKAPWIRGRIEGSALVRHNLDEPLLNQFVNAIEGNPVQELHVLAAFYDEKLAALRQLLDQINPAKCCVYLQRAKTSINPEALRALFECWPGKSEVRLYSAPGANEHETYCHAKLLIATTESSSICLHGSANMSQVAMLRTADKGNLEMANLLLGNRGNFDYLWDGLSLSDPGLAYLDADLSIHPTAEVAEHHTEGEWFLKAAALEDATLLLHCGTAFPFGSTVWVTTGHLEFECRVVDKKGSTVRVAVSEDLKAALQQPCAVRMRWSDERGLSHETNPVVPCNMPRLSQTMNASVASRASHNFGTLELEDDEIEQLLGEMASNLLVDRADVFRAAGVAIPKTDASDEQENPPDLSLIDWEAVRSSSRYRQYEGDRVHSFATDASVLAAVLGSISGQFTGFTEPRVAQMPMARDEEYAADRGGSTQDAGSQDLEEAQADELSRLVEQRLEQKRQRLWQLLKRFIRRFIRGTFSPGFAAHAGPSVVVKNYRVILHLLTLLLDRSRVRAEFDAAFLTRSTAEVVMRLWSEYLPSLTKHDAERAAEMLSENATIPGTLLAVALAWNIGEELRDDELKGEIRDAFQASLGNPTVIGYEKTGTEIDGALESAMLKQYRLTAADVKRLLTAAVEWQSDAELLGTLAESLNCSRAAVHLETPTIKIDGVPTAVRSLVISDGEFTDEGNRFPDALANWMRARSLRHYRIVAGFTRAGSWNTRLVLFYEPERPERAVLSNVLTWERSGFPEIQPASRWWDGMVEGCMSACQTSTDFSAAQSKNVW